MTHRIKCAHDTKPGDLDLPPMEKMYLDLDGARRLSVSAWCPSVKVNEVVMVTVGGTLFWRTGNGEFGKAVGFCNRWKPGDTDVPKELIKLEDGRQLWCKSWKVGPAGKDRGRALGNTTRCIEKKTDYDAVYVTMECYLMTEDDIKDEEFTD